MKGVIFKILAKVQKTTDFVYFCTHLFTLHDFVAHTDAVLENLIHRFSDGVFPEASFVHYNADGIILQEIENFLAEFLANCSPT